MIRFMTIGAILGLSAGIAPGPLLALVISETLGHDMKAGIKVALAPIITDTPIILLTLLVSATLPEFSILLGGISLAGAAFILYLGVKSIRTRGSDLEIDTAPSKSFQKGILVNALSPHPYLFWFSVGTPIITKAIQEDIYGVAGFISAFYILLVGSKIVVAMIAGKSGLFLTGRAYIYVMRALGATLCVFSVLLIRDGLRLMGWL